MAQGPAGSTDTCIDPFTTTDQGKKNISPDIPSPQDIAEMGGFPHVLQAASKMFSFLIVSWNMPDGAGECNVCSGFPQRRPPWAYSGLLWWLETQYVAPFINRQQEMQEISPVPHHGKISFIPSQQLKSILQHRLFVSLRNLTVNEIYVKMNAHWRVVFHWEIW